MMRCDSATSAAVALGRNRGRGHRDHREEPPQEGGAGADTDGEGSGADLVPFQLIVAIFPQATQRTFAVPFGYSVGAISWNGTSRTSLNPQRGRSKGDTHG